MKRSLFYFSIVILLIGALSACSNDTNSGSSTETPDECFGDRKTTSTIENQQGKIVQMGEDIFLISIDNKRFYNPCNLKDEWKVKDKAITFSGKVKEIFPNERWPGTPFYITSCTEN